MSKTVKILAVAAALCAPVFASAQDTTAPTADGNGAEGLALGTTEVEVGDTYILDTFTDWQVRCVLTEDGKDPCQIYQLLQDESGNSVAEVSLFNLKDGGQAAAGATVITPLETLLTADLRLAIDGGKAKRYPYSFCSPIGCFSRMGFTAAEIAQFQAGSSAAIVIVPAAAPDETVNLKVSLSGFTAAYKAVEAANADN